MDIGYHASHEQFAPHDLLEWCQQAEAAGFRGGMCSDHFAPWSESQGQAGFAWSWLGAALQATSWPMGTVTAPGYRYHPAITAQAAATLASMFPGRFWVALGSGEALNERPLGFDWPVKAERQARLVECVKVIRALWRGETVSHRGRVTAEEARLWTRPEQPPLLVGAALSAETAAWCGDWADALITVNSDRAQLAGIVAAFRERAGARKPVFLQAHVSWATTAEEAEAQATANWRTAVLPAAAGQELRSPQAFDALGPLVGLEEVSRAVRISAEVARHRAWLEEDLELGIDRVYLHNVGPNQAAFIDAFGSGVLPGFVER
jgi:coenzyme F420-dependent glucose-6-phosphate dehydrogenase